MVNKRIRYLVLSALFAALISLGAYIRFPTPLAPITLQTLFVTLSGLLLGMKYGSVSVLIYVCLGLLGLPVFTSGGGISYLLNPTFGYILGFIIACCLVGFLSERYPSDSLLKCFLHSAAGLIPIYFLGVLYFLSVTRLVTEASISFVNILVGGFLVFLPGDLLMCFVSSLIAVKLKKAIRYF